MLLYLTNMLCVAIFYGLYEDAATTSQRCIRRRLATQRASYQALNFCLEGLDLSQSSLGQSCGLALIKRQLRFKSTFYDKVVGEAIKYETNEKGYAITKLVAQNGHL